MEVTEPSPVVCLRTPVTQPSPWNVSPEYTRHYREKGVDAELAKFYGMLANLDENVGQLVRRGYDAGIARRAACVALSIDAPED